MISLSKSPSRWRMAMAGPILLAVVALACSKEQSAPAQVTKPLSLNFVKQLKITRDSIQVSFASADNKLFAAAKEGKGHFSIDTLGEKIQLDYNHGVEISGMDDRKPPPPPPASPSKD